MERKNKRHYAWMILLACCAASAGAYGIIAAPLGMYNAPVCQDMGFPIGQFVLYNTFHAIAMMATQIFAPAIYRRHDMKKIMLVTGCVYVLSSFLMGNSSRLYHWYILGAIQGITGGFFTGSAISVIICRWFFDKTAHALGIADACSFAFGILMNPVISSVIERYGWRFSYHLFACIGGLICLPLVFKIRNSPEECGMEPYRDENIEEDRKVQEYECRYGRRSTVILASSLIVSACLCNATGGYYTHIASYFVSIGAGLVVGSIYSSVELSGIFSFKLLVGPLVERIGVLKTEVLLYCLSLFSFLTYLFTMNMSVLYVAAFFSGIYSATNGVLLPIYARQQLGSRNYQSVIPLLSTASGVVSALSTTLFGYVYDVTGTYRLMFVICIVCNTLSIMNLFIAGRLENKNP